MIKVTIIKLRKDDHLFTKKLDEKGWWKTH